MKKILLTLALAGAAAFGAAAQVPFSSCFTVKYNGTEYAPEETIKCNHFEDLSDLFGDGMGTYECNIDIENKDIEPVLIKGTLLFKNPTYAQTLNDWTYGYAQLCYYSEANGSVNSGCLMGDNMTNAGSGTQLVPAEGVGPFQWQVHLSGALYSHVETYVLALQAVEEDGTPISEVGNFPIEFSAPDYNGVDEIVAAEGEGVWYDLQGRRVENPSKGLYIYKTATKAVKAIVK